MSTPVPKPRTKFLKPAPSTFSTPEVHQNDKDDHLTESANKFPESPSIEMLEEAFNRPIGFITPSVPPRPPNKPPRSAINPMNEAETAHNFVNVLGELKISLGEGQKTTETSAHTSPETTISPPNRIAPPPPRPAPPGWRPEIVSAEVSSPPPVPDRIASHQVLRKLPNIPVDPSHVVENPIYLDLKTLRNISGLEEPDKPTEFISDDDDCEQLREWLSEEEEEETFNSSQTLSRPVNLNGSVQSTSSAIAPLPPITPPPPRPPSPNSSLSRQYEIEDNAYTPCPRRSDFSVSGHIDGMIFPSTSMPSSSNSGKNENIYVSPKDMLNFKHTDYENVVEACSVDVKDLNSSYVNIGSAFRKTTLEDEEQASEANGVIENVKQGRANIDGTTVKYVGYVYLTSIRKEKRLHCRLRNMQLSFHEDEETTECAYGPYDVKDFYMFRLLKKEGVPPTDTASTSTDPPTSGSYTSILIHIGEKKQVVSFHPEDNWSSVWMVFLSEAWLSLFHGLTGPLRDATELTICGSIWIKQGSTGEWTHAAAGIGEMAMSYVLTNFKERVRRKAFADELTEIDLRKIMALKEKADKSEWCPNVKHKRGPLLMSLSGVTFFIDSRDENTTGNWFEAIDDVLKKPTNRLECYRLTTDDVPVIADKCMRFVAAYGLNSEGIYRKNGKVTEGNLIMKKLTEDPFGYHIVVETEETVFAVSVVFRRFLRNLDEPLVPISVQETLFEHATDTAGPALYEIYGKAISEMPLVRRATLKKLMAHLKHVTEHSEVNLASVENVAKIFAANIFVTESMVDSPFDSSFNEKICAIIHLINGYDTIFHITSEEEISRQMMKEAEKKSQHKAKYGADFIVPIHMWEKENRPFNVKIDLASEEVCREAVAKRDFDAPPKSTFAVFEMICEGQLMRRLAASEKISKTVLRWIDWECKNGYLLFDHDKHHYNGTDLSAFTGKIKMAEPGSKTFKSYEMKIDAGVSVSAYRNEKHWKSWSLDDSIWFVGAETARKAPFQFSATFLCTNKDGYCNRFAGYCVSFKEERDRTRWLNAVYYAQTGGMPESLVYI